TSSGQFQILAGKLVVNAAYATASGSFTNPNSTLAGTGTIGNPVQFASTATFAPGPATGGPGIFNTGLLSLPAGTNLNIDLNGTTAGSGFDQVNVTGNATLGGNLNVSVGFVPAVGNTFTILQTTGTVTGTFAGKANGSTFAVGGTTLSIAYNPNSVVLTVTAAAVPMMPRPMLVVLLIRLF